jgi:hypothetical protein
MVRIVPGAVICWMAKPGKENGSVGKKEHLIHDLLRDKNISLYLFLRIGVAKAARKVRPLANPQIPFEGDRQGRVCLV